MTDNDPSYGSFDEDPPSGAGNVEPDPYAESFEPPPESGIGSLAPVWARGVARLIDLFIAYMGGTFAANLVGAINYDEETVTIDNYPLYLVAVLGVWALYEVVGTIGRGRTVGKFFLGLQVRRVDAAVAPAPLKALTRWLVMAIAALFGPLFGTIALAVIYLSALTNPLMQGFHDRAAQTLVVRAR